MTSHKPDSHGEVVYEPIDDDIGRCHGCGEPEWYPLLRTDTGRLLCVLCFMDAHEAVQRQWRRAVYQRVWRYRNKEDSVF